MDIKKKKNRKKKGNQSKATDDVTASIKEAVVLEQDDASSQQSHHTQVSGNADVQSIGVSESDIELERHKVYEEKCVKLQEEVTDLENENSLRMQKEVSLEEKIKLLQNHVDCCIHKEAILEDQVKHIDGIKDAWILKETSINEMIARLGEHNLALQMQVKELKESTDNLVHENIELKEKVAKIESRIQCLETEATFSRSSTVNRAELPEEKNPEYQREIADGLMEKLDEKNAELVEKVNEVPTEPDQHDVAPKVPVALGDVTEPVRAATPIHYASECGEAMFESGEKIQSLVRAQGAFGIHNGVGNFGSLSGVRQGQLLGLDDSRISEEIVSVPLDDIQVQEAELQTIESKENPTLPLSDAPLIGAPFRLISFMAKYVSGADLVSQDRPKSGR